ncbi:hypothetical protein [Sulfuracidifex tepidarius]|uniref:hypothetical protein n=1 Tax=Sulfuracidifex tepidarius TaxID=1294262 RepID=UPI0006D227ED|nr:hypothetical protein [Sulfuracidifex tepidarius]
MDKDHFSVLREGEEFARKVYLRKVRLSIGIFYLFVSTYLPLELGLELAYLYLFSKVPLVSTFLHVFIFSPALYAIYVLVSSSLLLKLNRIPSVMERIKKLRENGRPKRLSGLTYARLSIIGVTISYLLSWVIQGETGELIGNIGNLFVLLAIIWYFHKIFSVLNVDKPSVPDYLALAGAVIGLVGGTFIGIIPFLIFFASWASAWIYIILKYR